MPNRKSFVGSDLRRETPSRRSAANSMQIGSRFLLVIWIPSSGFVIAHSSQIQLSTVVTDCCAKKSDHGSGVLARPSKINVFQLKSLEYLGWMLDLGIWDVAAASCCWLLLSDGWLLLTAADCWWRQLVGVGC